MPDIAPRYVAITDSEHRWLGLSADFARELGREPAELIGRPASEVVDETEELIDSRTMRLEAAGSHSGVVMMRRRDGTRFPWAYVMRAVETSDGRLYVTTGAPLDRRHPGAGGRALLPSEREAIAEIRLPPRELAVIGGLAVRTVERAMEDGELPYEGEPRHRLVRLEDGLRWLAMRGLTILLLVLAALAIAEGVDHAIPGGDILDMFSRAFVHLA